MYPGFAEDSAGWLAFAGFGVEVTDEVAAQTSLYSEGYTYWTDFLFQAMFAATAATIVSGAVAERIKLSSFMVFATLFVAVSYPITGSWKWGAGWLDMMETPFYDFAGSTIVHSVGGWGALAGAMLLGPRLGKYMADGRIRPILPSNMPLATIGVFLLWLGWFGFNGGSVLSGDPNLVSLTLVTTCIAAAAGGLGAMFTSWVILQKPDLSMALNGILAGLVGITAGADQMAALSATLIGLIAGAIVVGSVLFFDKIKIDDPGRGHLRPPGVRHLGHPGGRHFRQSGPGRAARQSDRRYRGHWHLHFCVCLYPVQHHQGDYGAAGLAGRRIRGPGCWRARQCGLRCLADVLPRLHPGDEQPALNASGAGSAAQPRGSLGGLVVGRQF